MNDKIKVLFFSNNKARLTEVSGSGNWVISLVEFIKKNNTEIELYVAYHDPKVNEIQIIKQEVVTYIEIPLNHQSKILQPFVSWGILKPYAKILKQYLEVIKKVNPSLIQIFGLESPFIRILGKSKVPILIHIQGMRGSCFYKILSRITLREKMLTLKIKNTIFNNSILFQKRRSLAKLKNEEKYYKYCQYFLGRTDWDSRYIKAITPHANYYYCQEIMRSQFYVSKWSKPVNSKFHIYTTIRMSLIKNVDMLYEVANLLERYNPAFKFIWNVAGLSEKELVPKIMKRRGIEPKNLKLLGRLNAQQIIEEMLQANLFVYPSAMENGCNAVQEAMLVGIPIVATHAGGVSTTINDGETGILVQEGDPYVMAGAILEAMENYEKSIEMAIKARKVAMKRHNPERVVKDLLNIYEEILHDK